MDHHLKNNMTDIKKITEAWQLIKASKKITLLTHFKPDGDGISACAALEHILKKFDKKVETIYPCPPEFDIKRQPQNLLINKHHQIPDLIIISDTANYERAYYPEIFKNIPLINIDHHISNTITGAYNFINPNLSSACEVLFLILYALDHQLIDVYVAECLLSGILCDSLVFQTQATSAQTLNIAAYLMDQGANLFQLKTEILANKNPHIITLWGKLLSSIKISPSENVAYAVVTQQDLKPFGLKLNSLVGFHNFLSQLSTIDVTILFYETESHQTKVSLRSKAYDVNQLATQFGGGGHKHAAGILLDEPIHEVVKKISTVLEKI